VDIAKKNNRTLFPPKNSEKIHVLIILRENRSNTLTSEKWNADITPLPTTRHLSPGEYLQTTPHLVIFVSPHMPSHIAKFYSCNSPV
jgi:hypothetical protein